ncbi:MAG: hypothetical protein ACI4W6_01070 [Acutalibacteraceae bacterium]
MNIVRTMNRFFRDLGFEKVKKTFFKNINEDYIVAIELSRERNYTIIESSLHTSTDLDYYNIYISIYHKIKIEAFSMTHKDMGSFYPLTAIADIEESEWLENNPNLEKSMKEAFNKNIYKPLFVDQKIFDFIYNLDYKRFGKHYYDSDELLMAAYDEKKYETAKKCLHTLLVLTYDPDCRDCISAYDSLTIEDLIYRVDQLNNLNASEKYLFTVYKELYSNIKTIC